ncbi:hypothetical protein GCM10009559_64250 [Pseudonocardia zijingensis]|uniref:Uncharacterized protein n=1 Tax=Pseudonocardia zijingensis TaxID=153376 RepID=A0ABN1NA90_9PSEU
MFTYNRRVDPLAPDERASTIAAATSNSGYSTISVALTGPTLDPITNISAAHTIAKPNRTKYRFRRADAFLVRAEAAAVVMGLSFQR